MNQYRNYEIEDFLNDEKFVKWVLNPDEKGDNFFSLFQEKYPERKHEFLEAAYLIKAVQPIESEISADRLSQIWSDIERGRTSKKRKWIFRALKYAAVFIFFIVAGGIYYLWNDSLKFQSTISGLGAEQKGQIILSDGTVKYFDTEKTIIKHLSTGIAVNDDTLKEKGEIYDNSPSALNHIILPYGMRSEVVLVDGTHVYLNSGTKFSYPTKFDRNTRNVYLSGEAYLEVKKNEKKPFYVYTNNLRIKVTGTSFNVSSYADDQTAQVVLVEGKVNVKKNDLLSKSMDISPGERAVFNKDDDTLQKEKTDVDLYTSWIYGYLIFEKSPLAKVAKKLERYYKKKIVVAANLQPITFSGKLDLNKGVDDVLKYISFASSIKIENKNECIILK